MNISGNYQLSFGALVPKAKYSGTPKLSPQAISEIKGYKELLKTTEKEVIDLENNINNPDNHGLVINYLKTRLQLLNGYRKRIQEHIDITKRYGITDHTGSYKLQKEHRKEIAELNGNYVKGCSEGRDIVNVWG